MCSHCSKGSQTFAPPTFPASFPSPLLPTPPDLLGSPFLKVRKAQKLRLGEEGGRSGARRPGRVFPSPAPGCARRWRRRPSLAERQVSLRRHVVSGSGGARDGRCSAGSGRGNRPRGGGRSRSPGGGRRRGRKRRDPVPGSGARHSLDAQASPAGRAVFEGRCRRRALSRAAAAAAVGLGWRRSGAGRGAGGEGGGGEGGGPGGKMPLAQLADPWQKMAVESPSDNAEVSAAGAGAGAPPPARSPPWSWPLAPSSAARVSPRSGIPVWVAGVGLPALLFHPPAPSLPFLARGGCGVVASGVCSGRWGFARNRF